MLNRVCRGYNYLITRRAPSCMLSNALALSWGQSNSSNPGWSRAARTYRVHFAGLQTHLEILANLRLKEPRVTESPSPRSHSHTSKLRVSSPLHECDWSKSFANCSKRWNEGELNHSHRSNNHSADFDAWYLISNKDLQGFPNALAQNSVETSMKVASINSNLYGCIYAESEFERATVTHKRPHRPICIYCTCI